jgi:hypothetical protein
MAKSHKSSSQPRLFDFFFSSNRRLSSFFTPLPLALLSMMDDPRTLNRRISVEFTRAKQEEQDRLSFSREDGGLPDFHRLSLSDLQSQFDLVDVSTGLTGVKVTQLRNTYGRNVLSTPKKNPIWMWLGFFFGGFNGFLWFSAALSWVAWGLGYLVREQIVILPSNREIDIDFVGGGGVFFFFFFFFFF